MEIRRRGSRACSHGVGEWFTGRVHIDPLFGPTETSRTGGALVTFSPGARSAWHSHPLGQALFVVEGVGWVQRQGGPIQEVRQGDVVCLAPHEMHWHGASPTEALTQVEGQEACFGSPVTWHGSVSESEYRRFTIVAEVER